MLDLFAVKHAYLIPLLPLLGAVLAGFFGAKFLKQNSHWPIWIGVGASALLSLSLLFGMIAVWHTGPVKLANETGAHPTTEQIQKESSERSELAKHGESREF